MLIFNSAKVVSIGEAMVEMAVVGDNRYQQNFAGDTFNTAWHMAQVLGDAAQVGFFTCIGADTLSKRFLAQMIADGVDTSAITQIVDRNMGLYLIELDETERSFHYWRGVSAAKLLADDRQALDRAIEGAGLIHISGITLAILAPDARTNLFEALSKARKDGARVSFDPNIRARLWASTKETQQTVSRFLEVTDIALPSFDDEQTLWGDKSPDMTIDRLSAAGVSEIVVKNGAAAVNLLCDGRKLCVETPSVTDIRDTSGAGDAFNAGYLAGRLHGRGAQDAIAVAQALSAEVIRHFGARIPVGQVPRLSNEVHEPARAK